MTDFKQLITRFTITTILSSTSLLAYAGDGTEEPSSAEMWQLIQKQQEQISRLENQLASIKDNQSIALVTEAAPRAAGVSERDGGTTEPQKGALNIETAQGFSVGIGGFVRADYSVGDRYGTSQGDDSLGVSRAALAAKVKKDNVTGVLVLGTGRITNASGGFKGDVVLADAFVVWDKIGGSDFTLSAGVQPLLFGLKPNGFPFDRSLQESVEYGAAGNFAVANQAGPSVIASYQLSEQLTLQAGVFDQRDSNDVLGEGTNISENFFFQARGANLFGSGLYGVVGYEKRFVAATGRSEPVFDIGLGYQAGALDVSFEYISIDRALAQTLEDETYLIAEATWAATDNTSAYVDFSRATEADINTYRVGLWRDISSVFRVTGEFALDNTRGASDQSFDLRLTVNY